MCGILGFIGNFNPLQLDHMTDMIDHRGPDDRGIYQESQSSLALAHTRLSIIDLSPSGHQPMCDAGGKYVIVFNGEIYNYRELRQSLESQGTSFRGHSDTEVVVELYARLGAQMLTSLNGIFALAVWDKQTKELFLARDGLGVKPLYVLQDERGIAFASESKALQPLLQRHSIDVAALDRYITYLWCPGDATPVREIRRLNPGEALTVTPSGKLRRWRWYSLPVSHNAKAQGAGLSLSQTIAATQSHLRKAVQRQLVSDVPVGAFLSGGLDSSSVVAFAREQNPDICCFTIEATGADEDGIADDLPYARRVAAHLKVPLEVVRIDAARMATALPAMVAQLDEPLADPAALNVLYISRLAREHGIKVLLSGAGGDDLFTGYRRHRALMSEGLWSWLPRPARAGLERLTVGLDQHRPLFRRLRKLFNGASLDGDARLVNYFRWVDRRDLMTLYSPEFRAALGNARAEDPMLAFLADLPRETHRLERMLALEQRFFLADHNLTYTDKMSMAVGVEVRVPFLDLDLVEFAARIPAQFKQRGREGKWVLKKAMEPYLPHDVIYRPKSGFGAPLRRWMRVELRDLLADVLGEQSLRQRGLFDPSAVQSLIQANDQGKIDASYTLLSLMCIELWCRWFIDQATPVPRFPEASS